MGTSPKEGHNMFRTISNSIKNFCIKTQNGILIIIAVILFLMLLLIWGITFFEVERVNFLGTQIDFIEEEYIYVKDKENFLSPSALSKIANKSKQLDVAHKVRFKTDIIKTTNGQNIEDYSLKRFKELGLDSKELNNGVLLVIVPFEKIVHIETGHEIEGISSLSKLNEKINNKALKNLKEQKFDEAITDIYFAVVEEAERKYSPSIITTTSSSLK